MCQFASITFIYSIFYKIKYILIKCKIIQNSNIYIHLKKSYSFFCNFDFIQLCKYVMAVMIIHIVSQINSKLKNKYFYNLLFIFYFSINL